MSIPWLAISSNKTIIKHIFGGVSYFSHSPTLLRPAISAASYLNRPEETPGTKLVKSKSNLGQKNSRKVQKTRNSELVEDKPGPPIKKKKVTRAAASAVLLSSVGEALGRPFIEKYTTTSFLASSPISSGVDELIPSQCKKISSNIPTSAYLLDPVVAKKYVELVKADVGPDFAKRSGPIIELSPGLGILTSELFSTFDFPQIIGLEESEKFSKFLTTQRNWSSGPHKLSLLEKGFPEFPRIHHVDKVDGGSRISELLSRIKDKSPNSQNLVIFGAIPHVSLINFIIRCSTTRTIFYDEDWGWGDPTYYVALGSKPHWILSAGPASGFFAYRPASVIFQLLFKCKVLGELPRSAWIPWASESTEGKSHKFQLRNDYDHEKIFLCRIESNTDVLARLGRDNLVHFWYFVRQHLYSRKKAVIAELEGWIPGCGARLIRKGLTIYTQFGELSPEQILDIYLQFISWPEFPGCSFSSAVEKFQSRLDLHDDEAH